MLPSAARLTRPREDTSAGDPIPPSRCEQVTRPRADVRSGGAAARPRHGDRLEVPATALGTLLPSHVQLTGGFPGCPGAGVHRPLQPSGRCRHRRVQRARHSAAASVRGTAHRCGRRHQPAGHAVDGSQDRSAQPPGGRDPARPAAYRLVAREAGLDGPGTWCRDRPRGRPGACGAGERGDAGAVACACRRSLPPEHAGSAAVPSRHAGSIAEGRSLPASRGDRILHGASAGYLSTAMPNAFSLAPAYTRRWLEGRGAAVPERDALALQSAKLHRLFRDGVPGQTGIA